MVSLQENMEDVSRLLEIHQQITGTGAGRRRGVEVLNKSGLVLATACWEAFVEGLATEGFHFMLSKATSHNDVPAKVRAMASKPLRDAQNECEVWRLAGDGWRMILWHHEAETVQAHIGSFNTPKPQNIDPLFRDLLGLGPLSSCWYWSGMSAARARSKLEGYIRMRGDIAHRARTAQPVAKSLVDDYADLIWHLAVRSANHVRSHLHQVTGRYPWSPYKYVKK